MGRETPIGQKPCAMHPVPVSRMRKNLLSRLHLGWGTPREAEDTQIRLTKARR